MTTSKSPRRVFQVAYDAAREALPTYSHVNSPRTFTQPQLLACLVLKQFLRLDYRGFAQHLAEHAEMTAILGLERIPHFTTFQKAAEKSKVSERFTKSGRSDRMRRAGNTKGSGLNGTRIVRNQ